MTQTTLTAPLRKQLEKAVARARDVAEEAAADAIRRLAVGEARPRVPLADDAAALRRRLRAHARALGDRQEESGSLTTARLQEAAAYEIWHRMLFSRFLVERGLLRHPDLGVAMTLAELAEMASEEGAADAWGLAERYAAATLPAVFKPEDPVLAMPLDPYHHKQLQELATGLDGAVFLADDALGWGYQFWRTAENERINDAGGKIGAVELPAMTQLFTEPYMVRFLLHNTLGAWWAGRVLARQQDLAHTPTSESELRAACALPGIDWEYLRFTRDPANTGPWRPAAGTFSGWPDRAAEISVLDPCCGSGHFLIEALPILVALRMAEEGLAPTDAARAVLQENLHGLELDGRCVQIAAFAVALTAWRIAGSAVNLPNPHIAWVGAPPPLPLRDFRALAGDDADLDEGLAALHDLFAQAPLLGSLIDPVDGDLMSPQRLGRLEPLLEKLAAKARRAEPETSEGVIAARGMVDAAAALGKQYTLVVTNVPFLGRGEQAEELAKYSEKKHPNSKACLSTTMLERILRLSMPGCSVATVTKQEWCFLVSYTNFRRATLGRYVADFLVFLGEEAWEAFGQRGPLATLSCFTNAAPQWTESHICIDATKIPNREDKARNIADGLMTSIRQADQFSNPDARISSAALERCTLLNSKAQAFQGIISGDGDMFRRQFWEIPLPSENWAYFQSTPKPSDPFSGRDGIVYWKNKGSDFARKQGLSAFGRRGIAITQFRTLTPSFYYGDMFDNNISAVIPVAEKDLLTIATYCMSEEYKQEVRKIDSKKNVTNATLTKVPFLQSQWESLAEKTNPNGFPEPYSDDPTQWLFHGHPAHAAPGTTLHVALARVAGYRWPAEADTGMRLSPVARDLIAQTAVLPEGDADGLLPLHAQGTDGALAERLRAMLAAAYGSRWSNALEAELVREADMTLDKKAARDISLETWLRDRAFRQHCGLFHDRPFLWQVWDGLPDGFSAFLHYHRLSHATLQTLTYTVLGYWLTRAKHDGRTAHVEKASVLQQKLDAILQGESPYDIFVRWKPLAQQPLGWDPDLDDGVRMNIRPFVKAGVLRDTPNIRWTKDRGKDTASAPWYAVFDGDRINDHHTSLAEKQASRAKP